ncbi:hypothetical protein KQX63_20865 [Rhodopseudomonas palustris]|uniref:hypothetical protein n=1 Tax=Rhodopseudomonas palustris TaxID=1076 RepID=UPI0021F3AC2A|nr:hypothetical protein [Rhodopseudomonas palustris]UYO43802.1 hypothetical protein KQX63_20865 [Rhodopseudomonas palustris]
MLKFITEKLLGQILPSVVATVIAAYVVNQYIVARPDAPPPAAPATQQLDTTKAAKPAEPVAVALPAEAARSEPTRSEPLKVKLGADKISTEKAAADKPADRPVGRHQITAHDNKPAAPSKPVSTASATPEPVKVPEERSEPARDPNELVRAAVERLRASAPAEAPRATETLGRAPEPLKVPESPRAQEPPRQQEAARVIAPALPPAVNVAPTNVSIAPYANPPATTASVPASNRPADSIDLHDSDQHPPTPPADIPGARADASSDGNAARKPSVAEDVLFTAKSVIHSVLPR